MLRLVRSRLLPVLAAALLSLAASQTGEALFRAPAPGAALAPLDGAGQLVQILQGNQTVLWTSLSGQVVSYRVEGWPATIDGNDLGGALVIERPGDGEAGVIDTGERPRSIDFELARG